MKLNGRVGKLKRRKGVEKGRREGWSDDEKCEEIAYGITHHMQMKSRVDIVLFIT